MSEPEVQRGQQPGHLGLVKRIFRRRALGAQPPAFHLAGPQVPGRSGRVGARRREGVDDVDEFGFRGPESCKTDIEQGCFRRENLEPGNQ